MQTTQTGTLACDIETGICEIQTIAADQPKNSSKKPVKLLYFTDPICSSCWGIEPQLRKLKQEYGALFDIEYRMGGLLKSWDEYSGSDVNGPASVAQHWQEAAAHYQMPIDGTVWNEDPLQSSYPPSIAFKAAQLQGNELADQFLRRIKEMIFVENKNISRLENLLQAAEDVSLDVYRFESDYKNKAEQLFQEDLQLAREWGVRGFPTIYFIDEDDNRFKVYGSKPYEVYEQALLKLLAADVSKEIPDSYESILNSYDTFSLKEFAVFYDKTLAEAELILAELEQQNKFIRAGYLWKRAR